MAENNNEFHDPLDDVIARATQNFNGHTNNQPINTTETPIVNEPEKTEESYQEEPDINIIPNDLLDDLDLDDDDEFGNNDFEKEMAAEEERIAAERAKQVEEAKKAAEVVKTKLPPQSLDKNFQREAIDFQADNLAIVTGMIEKVKAKYHLRGGIPEIKQPPVMGDLMEEYYINGETITEKFEKIILDNWVHVDEEGHEISNSEDPNQTSVAPTKKELKEEPAQINIDVPTDTPVTVNIDDNVVNEITKSRVININVREVTSKDMEAVTVIENSQKEGIIRSFDTGMGYTPVTLPLSAYRCQIKPLNFFDMINMIAPDSKSKVDFHLKRWRIIFDHLKSPSIGPFKDFEDFLKQTKFADLPLLEWGVLAATAGDDEPVDLICGNPKCKKSFVHSYSPRTLIHPNPDRLPKEYAEIGTAAGERANVLFDMINGKHRRYKLPKSGVIVELNEPSAYEYLTVKLPMIIKKYAEKRPDDPFMDNFNEETLSDSDGTLVDFSYKMALMMRISAIVVPPPEDEANNFNKPHEYRYTNWEDIESQVDLLDLEDSIVLLKLISNQRETASPVDFYLVNVTCPHCGRVEEKLVLSNLMQNLLFRMSRRLQNTEIKLIELD